MLSNLSTSRRSGRPALWCHSVVVEVIDHAIDVMLGSADVAFN